MAIGAARRSCRTPGSPPRTRSSCCGISVWTRRAIGCEGPSARCATAAPGARGSATRRSSKAKSSPVSTDGCWRSARISARHSDRLADRLLQEQLSDGGWNCDAPPSQRSSFHTTICVLEGLLEYETAKGPRPDVTAARLRGQEYLLERRLFRSRSTGQIIARDEDRKNRRGPRFRSPRAGTTTSCGAWTTCGGPASHPTSAWPRRSIWCGRSATNTGVGRSRTRIRVRFTSRWKAAPASRAAGTRFERSACCAGRVPLDASDFLTPAAPGTRAPRAFRPLTALALSCKVLGRRVGHASSPGRTSRDVLWRPRRDRAGARRTPKPRRSPFSAIWFTTTRSWPRLQARGIADRPRRRAREDAPGDGDGAWRIGADARQDPRARPGDRRSDLPARARGASGHQGARSRRLSPGHHRPARPRGGARADRRSRRRSTSCCDERDVLALEEHPRLGIAAQTTQPIEKVRHLVALIRQRFPQSDVRFIDTVCQPTKQRQNAAVDLARQCDVVIVVGGANSNNTRELVNTCSRYCSHVHHVQTESDLRAEWFRAAQHRGHHRRHVDARRCHRSRRAAHPGARRRTTHVRLTPRRAAHDASTSADATGCSSSCSPSGMAWVEAACVYYLRVMVDRVEPYQAESAADAWRPGTGRARARSGDARDAAGRRHARRPDAAPRGSGYTAIAFGVWDIFYYVFLKIIYDWPKSLFDWDILFLLPLPWWGPVLAPVCIAALMIVWGTLVTLDAVRDPVPAGHFDMVALQRTRYRVGALRVHGRFVSRGQPGSDRDRERYCPRISIGRCSPSPSR